MLPQVPLPSTTILIAADAVTLPPLLQEEPKAASLQRYRSSNHPRSINSNVLEGNRTRHKDLVLSYRPHLPQRVFFSTNQDTLLPSCKED